MPVEEVSRSTDDTLRETLCQRIQERTGGRLWWLWVELRDSQVVIHGSSPSYYVVQLALVAVREVFPERPVELDIQVGFNSPQPFDWHHDPAGTRLAPALRRSPQRTRAG